MLIYLFIYLFRERTSRGGAERESHTDSTLSAQSLAWGSISWTTRSRTGCLTDWATQVPQKSFILKTASGTWERNRFWAYVDWFIINLSKVNFPSQERRFLIDHWTTLFPFCLYYNIFFKEDWTRGEEGILKDNRGQRLLALYIHTCPYLARS